LRSTSKTDSNEFHYYPKRSLYMKYRVWYQKNFHGEGKTQEFAMVREVEAEGLEDVFVAMQGEVWSPNGEARPLIKSLGLHHTSMSVGDFIETPSGEFYRVEGCGFEVYDSLPVGEPVSCW
jgi:hypothetical protein